MRRLLILSLAFLVSLVTATQAAEPVQVKISTTAGDIVLALNAEQAPETVDNFLRYVDEGFYSDTIFHRVIPNFMIQGGGFTTDYAQKDTHQPVTNESDNGVKNLRGTIAMARTNDPHSATAQFFINHTDNSGLDYSSNRWGYAVFGEVVAGMDVVDSIATLKTGAGGPFGTDVPQNMVIITSISRL
jgi:cyclophilin family peptidyl-prolyl cis-trans isomerase